MDQQNNIDLKTSKNTKSKKSHKPISAKMSKASKARKTDGKTKGHKVKKANNKKSQINLKPEQISKIIQIVKDIVIGCILGAGAFFALISEFGLSWNHKNWPEGSLLGGLIKSWNVICDTLASSDGVFLTKLMGEGNENGLFLTVVLIISVVVSSLIVMGRIRWMALIYPAICIIPTIIWNVHSSVISICIMALGIMLFLINTEMPKLKYNFRGLIYAFVMAFLAFVIISVPGITKLADRTDAVNSIRQDAIEDISNKYYGENPLYDGKLNVKKRGSGVGTALKVSMQESQPMYLRGFVGDVLEKDRWVPLSSPTYYNQVNFVYWMHANGFNGLGQLGQSAELAKQGGSKKLNANYYEVLNNVSVKNVGANSKYAYIPYEITIDGVEGTKNWGDNFLTAEKYKKIKEYSFTTHENATDEWTEYASKLFTNKVTPVSQYSYMQNESHYNAYVYQKYTYISPEDRDILDIAMPAAGDQTRGHVEYNKAIKSIQQLISLNFTYSDELYGYSKNASALTNIFNSQVGYDSQLATAAVMMFRYYGIPARYVEGYLITSNDVMYGETNIDVSKANAHAWCEIYVDGLGFVPVEVCDEYKGLMPEADYTKGIQTKQKNPNPDMSKTNEQDPNITIEDTSSNISKKMSKKGVFGVAGIVALIVILLLIIAIIKLVKVIKKISARRKLFKSGDVREAVKAIYSLMLDLELPIDDEARDIGNRATYSEHVIVETERVTMLSKLRKFKKKKKVDKRLERAKRRIERSRLSEDKKKKKMDALLLKSKGTDKTSKSKHHAAQKTKTQKSKTNKKAKPDKKSSYDRK